MSPIVEVDDRGAIQLPPDLLAVLKPHTRFAVDIQGATLVLRPVAGTRFWETATPQERAHAVRQWAEAERPAAPVLPETALHRDDMYD